MLQNLDTCIEDIQEGLDDDGEYIHNEYAGDSLPIKFIRVGSDIHAMIDIGDKHHEFIVTNLI